MEKENLIIEAASKVHENWCIQEYKAFWDRARKIYHDGEKNIGNALRKACYKNDVKRNEIFIDIAYMVIHETEADTCLNNFDVFMSLVRAGAIDIKKFTKRKLTEEEKKENITNLNYKKETEEENILRNFKYLSAESKKENLEASISAYKVFEELSKCGISIEQMMHDSKIRYLIGVGIHTDWLKRNKNHSNESLKVAYEELDEWTKGQDLTVFEALISVVKSKNFTIQKEENYSLPDYLLEEQQVLENLKSKNI